MNTKYTKPENMTGAAMRGKIEIDEDTLSDDANFWRLGAFGALESIEKKLYRVMTSEEAFRCEGILNKYWKSTNTWKHICLKTEKIRDLIKMYAEIKGV